MNVKNGNNYFKKSRKSVPNIQTEIKREAPETSKLYKSQHTDDLPLYSSKQTPPLSLNQQRREITSSYGHYQGYSDESSLKSEDKSKSTPLVFPRHITQRALFPIYGSRVRGVEMLPSYELPNIPSTKLKSKITPINVTELAARHKRGSVELGDVVVVKPISTLIKGASTESATIPSLKDEEEELKRPQTTASVIKRNKN